MKNRTKYILFLLAQTNMLLVIAESFKAEASFETVFAIIASLLSVGWIMYEGVVNQEDVRGKAITHLPQDRCVFFHRWKRVKGNNITEYHECSRCGARRVQQQGEGYQPVDMDWLFEKDERPVA